VAHGAGLRSWIASPLKIGRHHAARLHLRPAVAPPSDACESLGVRLRGEHDPDAAVLLERLAGRPRVDARFPQRPDERGDSLVHIRFETADGQMDLFVAWVHGTGPLSTTTAYRLWSAART